MELCYESSGCGAPPRLHKQIGELIGADAGKPHEDQRIVQVVIGDVEDFRLFCQQHLAVCEVDGDDKRLAVLMQSYQYLPADLKCRSAVASSLLSTGQFERELAHLFPGDWLLFTAANASF